MVVFVRILTKVNEARNKRVECLLVSCKGVKIVSSNLKESFEENQITKTLNQWLRKVLHFQATLELCGQPNFDLDQGRKPQ